MKRRSRRMQAAAQPAAQPAAATNQRSATLRMAAAKARESTRPAKTYEWEIKPPDIMPGVVQDGKKAPVLAMDSQAYSWLNSQLPGGGFPGFQYLAQLSTRAEFRQMASALSTEITRRWIDFTSTQNDGDESAEKIKQIESEFKRLNVRGIIQKAAADDCLFGRGQILLNVGSDDDLSKPLILDPRTVPRGTLNGLATVEAVWTTPAAYNALNPAAPDFYRPNSWFMLGKEVHSSRLLTVATRPLPDILKPAFNFAGMSLSQLAEPYVDNWLRTRQSVSDLINNFSITVLATRMEQVLQGGDANDLFARADLFTATRSNRGLMLLDKDSEEISQVNTPLSGLHELQAQAQEHMCSVSRMPAIILTGISPSGLNASSDGEIRVFYDWIAAQQEAFWRHPIEVVLKVVQLSLFGEIDPAIGFNFVPLYQLTEKEHAEIRESNARTAAIYLDHGVIDASEERKRLAESPDSGYQGIDADAEVFNPDEFGGIAQGVGNKIPSDKQTRAMDSDFKESEHPRADNGQFSSGNGGQSKVQAGGVYSFLAKHEDRGGRAAVEKAAYDLIANQPELESEVYREMSDLGYSLPRRLEKPREPANEQNQEKKPPPDNVSQEFGEPEFVRPGAIEPPHEVRDKKKLADLVKKMQANGWQGRPVLTVDLGRGPEALTGSHRIRAAKQAGIDVPTIAIDPEIGNYEDDNGKTIRDAMWWEADEIADYLEKAGEMEAAKLMRAEHDAQERGYEK